MCARQDMKDVGCHSLVDRETEKRWLSGAGQAEIITSKISMIE